MVSVVVPWSLASYVPLGAGRFDLRGWMQSQVDVTLVRPGSGVEVHALARPPLAKRHHASRGFGRFSQFKTIATSMDLNELDRLACTAGDIELHHSMPFTSFDRTFVLCIDHPSRMFAPFLFDDSYQRRREMELALPLIVDMLDSEWCAAVFVASHSTLAFLKQILPSKLLSAKVHLATPVVPVTRVARAKRSAPVFLAVSKPAVHDAFGRKSHASRVDRVSTDLMTLAIFQNVLRSRPDARLLWLCPDRRQTPRWSIESAGFIPARQPLFDDLEAVVDSEAITVLPVRPNEREFGRILAQADLLIDISPELDATLALNAASVGCVPVLADTPQARDLLKRDHTVLFDVGEDCWRRNPLGFIEGYDQTKLAAEQVSVALLGVADACLELIGDPFGADRLRTSLRNFVEELHSGYSSGSYAFASLPQRRGSLAGGSWPALEVTRTDFIFWPCPDNEHRVDDLEIVDVGSGFYARLAGSHPGSLDEPPLPHLTSNSLDDLLLRLADFRVFSRPVIWKAEAPEQLPVIFLEAAEGSIDTVAGCNPDSTVMVHDLVTVTGWTAVSGQHGIAADAVYVTVASEDGRLAYIEASRKRRDDIKALFRQPDMLDAGFEVTIDVHDMPEDLLLGLARKVDGRIERCGNFEILIQRQIGIFRDADREPVRPAFGTTTPYGKPTLITDCREWNVDRIDGRKPASPTEVGDIVEIEGWMTVVGRDATIPDTTFVTLTSPDQQTAFVKTRPKARSDIKRHFDRADMDDPGFIVTIDLRDSPETLFLGLARRVAKRIEVCGDCKLELRRVRT